MKPKPAPSREGIGPAILGLIACILFFLLGARAHGQTPNNGCTIECREGTAIIECPVNAACPDSTGEATLTVKDGKAKSVSPCGCCTKCTLPPCVADGTYSGKCANHLCTYTIACKCSPTAAKPVSSPQSPIANPFFADSQPAQTPNLILSAGTAGQASSLGITSDSARAWKRFAISGGSAGTWNVVSAEHGTGDDGGIYYYTLTVAAGSASLPPSPVPLPPSSDLPIGSLSTAVSAAIAGVDPAILTMMANSYEALAKQIDAGTIVSPMQLQVATGTQLLTNFSADQLASFKGFNTAVAGWLDAQQCAGKLTAESMTKYATVYHAIAAAVRPIKSAASAKPPRGSGAPAEAPKAESPCAKGQCPAPPAKGSRRRGATG